MRYLLTDIMGSRECSCRFSNNQLICAYYGWKKFLLVVKKNGRSICWCFGHCVLLYLGVLLEIA